MQRIKYYLQLIKLRLSTTVVFSAIAGYLLGVESYTDIIYLEILFLALGGILVVGSANGLNQVLERHHDKLMQRTSGRPLPTRNLLVPEAVIFCLLIGVLGLAILYQEVNPYCSYYGFASIILYVFCYTPLKRISPISILVGAVPGAIPFLLGWVGSHPSSSGFELASGILFAIQFFWQFPHFIAISWVQDEDYKKAGFKMMFGGKKGKTSVIISIISSIFLMLASISPYFIDDPRLAMSFFGIIIILTLNVIFISYSIRLYVEQDDHSAKKLMIFSFIYLPLLQVSFIFDKYYLINF